MPENFDNSGTKHSYKDVLNTKNVTVDSAQVQIHKKFRNLVPIFRMNF